MECPKCGKPRKDGDQECSFCGIHYSIFDQKQGREEKATTDKTIPAFDSSIEDAKVKTACPKCGQEYKIRSEQVGLKTRCKKCKTTFETAPLA
jgi:predicted Zn finger-like uncharacterized protein